jgi:ApbE superfamily uncharacterized protein (UPF0280 family)
MAARGDGSHVERTYRERMRAVDLVSFGVKIEQTDLYILAESDLTDEAMRAAATARRTVEAWIERNPAFGASLEPVLCPADAPRIIREMCAAAQVAVVGPMAAVAGAIAERVARDLAPQSPNVIVENGGDAYLMGDRERTVAIFAGPSPLSNRLGLVVPADSQPLAVCTSSGTVGPSLSFGKADAAAIVAENAALADAVATATANRIKQPEDIAEAVEWAAHIQGVLHVLAVAGDQMAAWGELQIRRLAVSNVGGEADGVPRGQ